MSKVVSPLPSRELVDKVLAGTIEMGLALDRDEAVGLLARNHNNASDAINAAFG
eukprot:SAG31_NODE_548_length_14222_cov_10.926574_16_plen_54_part_00